MALFLAVSMHIRIWKKKQNKKHKGRRVFSSTISSSNDFKFLLQVRARVPFTSAFVSLSEVSKVKVSGTFILDLYTIFLIPINWTYFEFFLKVEQQWKENRNGIYDDYFFTGVQHLVCCFPNRVSCCSSSKPSINNSFYEEQKPSHSCHVLGYKLNHSWYVGWRIFLYSCI